jgi:ketosteroid isomerase-like protein
MPAFPREEMEQMVERWLETNRRCEESGDWAPLADMYTEDATYGWNLGPNTEVMAVGQDEIREICLGSEMEGLEGWTYPYEEILIDDGNGQVVGFWRQIADATRPDGSPYEVAGLAASWFRYGGDGRWSWQRDFFDFGNVVALFMEMIDDGVLSKGMQRRLKGSGGRPRGHYPLGEAPADLWP